MRKNTKMIIVIAIGLVVCGGLITLTQYQNKNDAVTKPSVSATDPYLDSKIKLWKKIADSNDLTELEHVSKSMANLDTNDFAKVKDLKDKVDNKIKAINEEQNRPLHIVGTFIDQNSIGTPILSLKLTYDGQKVIDAFKIQAICYNSFGERTGDKGGIFDGIAQNKNFTNNIDIYKPYSVTWNLALYPNTTKADVEITEIHFTDGTTWQAQ